MTDADELADHLPLTQRVFLILWALNERPLHGYGLLREVEDLSRGRVTIKAGSLYEAIDSLTARGLIEPVDEPDDDAPKSRKKTLRITSLGREVFVAEARRLEELVDDLRLAEIAGIEGGE